MVQKTSKSRFENAQEATGDRSSMSAPPPIVGDHVKVFLPGESPWAECVGHNEDGTWSGKILNRLYHEMEPDEQAAFTGGAFGRSAELPKMHNFKQGQVVRFTVERDIDWLVWVPAT